MVGGLVIGCEAMIDGCEVIFNVFDQIGKGLGWGHSVFETIEFYGEEEDGHDDGGAQTQGMAEAQGEVTFNGNIKQMNIWEGRAKKIVAVTRMALPVMFRKWDWEPKYIGPFIPAASVGILWDTPPDTSTSSERMVSGNRAGCGSVSVKVLTSTGSVIDSGSLPVYVLTRVTNRTMKVPPGVPLISGFYDGATTHTYAQEATVTVLSGELEVREKNLTGLYVKTGLGGKKEYMFFWWHAGNFKLNNNETKHNASIIYTYLKGKGWNKKSISALLGNMQKESYINPGYWQSRREEPSNVNIGYGLTQWTPSSKYLVSNNSGNWNRNAYSDTSIFGQLERIIFEALPNNYGLQWLKNTVRDRAAALEGVPYDAFSDFAINKNSRTVESLAGMFYIYYECSDKVIKAGATNPTAEAKNDFKRAMTERASNATNWEIYCNW